MRISSLLPLLGLSLLLACGGGSGGGPQATPPVPPAPSGLTYTPPTSGTYQLVKSPLSKGTLLVLDLVGPAATPLRGLALELQLEGDALSWAKVDASDAGYARSDAFLAPESAVVTQVQGKVLKLVVAQKGAAKPALTPGATVALARIAVAFNPNALKGTLNLKPLTDRANRIPVDPKAPLEPLSLGIGTLAIQ